MAYASTYDKFDGVEYAQMLGKTKSSKSYTKKRRLKFCGIALGGSYDVSAPPGHLSTSSSSTLPTTTTMMMLGSSSLDEEMLKRKGTNNNAPGKKKHSATTWGCQRGIALVACVVVVVVGLVGLVAWVALNAASDPSPSSSSATSAIARTSKTTPRTTPTGATTTTHRAAAPSSSSQPQAADYPGYNNLFVSDATAETTPPTKTSATPTSTATTTKDANVEYVIPIKLGPKPLHMHDIIYDETRNILQKKNKPKIEANTESIQVNVEHVQVGDADDVDDQEVGTSIPSGHFRDNTAQVFDPHPEYSIEAFGRKFLLDLSQNSAAIRPDLRVVHIQNNYSRKIEAKTKPACYYTGIVREEAHSFVGVSLCNGMTGFLRTTHGEFQIEPVEDYDARTHANTSILHRMTKLPMPDDQHLGHHDHDEVFTNPIIYEPVNLGANKRRSTRSIKPFVYQNRFDEVYQPSYDDDIVNQAHQPYQSHQYQAAHYMHFGDDGDDQQRAFPDSQSTKPYFIATLVVADRKMYEYHKNSDDLTRYILTLMSHVAWLFKDATIGNPITLVVVDIMILTDIDFSSSTSADVLRKFCEYQSAHSHKKHDVALLFTRDVICKNASVDVCTTLGVAEVGSMCKPTSSCAIVRDKGLSTSFTIAHELGHVLSMPHDDDKKCAKINNGTTPNNIMAKSLHNDTRPWHWSQCSKHYLTEFLSSPRARCLLDEPQQDHIRSNPLRPIYSLLPGETFQADRQCELEFGPGSRVCSFMPECSTLWCTHEYDMQPGDSGCKTQYMPWADGTPCGMNMWCLQGNCIYKHDFKPTPGGWGRFKPSGSCSRTCGGGVQRYVRECNQPPPSNGGPYCTGGSTHYESCNTQPCPTDTPDFREVQCAHFNGNTKGLPLSQNVRWVPKYGTDLEEACKLYCRVDRSTSYYLLDNKVKDGTKCGLNSFDICINGVCRPAGCDNKLGSNVTFNDCGICGGDNSQCRTIRGEYNSSVYGYTAVVVIPKGSSNIVIRQLPTGSARTDENYLALKEPRSSEHHNRVAGEEYLLNGNSVISGYTKDIVYGGITFHYSGSSNSEEKIVTTRKARLTKDILVEVLQVGNLTAPNVFWSYTIRESEAPNYGWEEYNDGWSSCSSLCQGHHYRYAHCKDLTRQQIVDDDLCSSLPRGNPVKCNTHCELQWRLSARNACDCGTGWRDLEYKCVQVDISHKKQRGDRLVDSKHCTGLNSPPSRERCDDTCDSIHWKYYEWGSCSKSCGGGFQERRAICVDSNINILNDTYCATRQKHVKRVCNAEGCPTWFYQEWSPCSVSCGNGIKHRKYACRKGDQMISSSFCDAKNLVFEEACKMPSCFEATWRKGDWNECHGACGSTYQQRLVTCMDDRTGERLTEEHCRHLPRPTDTRACSLSSCDYEWITGDWGECSVKCGWGQQSRQVQCTHKESGRAGDDRYCDISTRPEETRNCQGQKCGSRSQNKPINWEKLEWVPGPFGKCSTMCGSGVRTREVKCHAHANNSRVKIVDDACSHLPRKPTAVKPCKRYHCSYAWKESNWSSCSASCGSGVKRREVSCYRIARNHRMRARQRNTRHMNCDKKVPPHYCPIMAKPKTEEACNEMNCGDGFHWKKSPWHTHRTPDGVEKQRRRVFCVDRQNMRVDDRKCLMLGHPKPKRRRKFNNNFRPCSVTAELSMPKNCRDVQRLLGKRDNNDYVLMLNGSMVQVYCYKMDTSYPEEFITLPPGESNYAEIYDKRLPSYTKNCPDERDDCIGCETMPQSVGKSMFWKVRIDIDAMRIIADDFTFSQNTTQHRVPYGTAGDCFSSMSGCIRGRFQIDLSGTSFRLASNVAWIAHGQHPTKKITQNNRHKVSGLCGGDCGGCRPNPRIGLKVEVT